MSLLQLTVLNSAIVYDLQPMNRFEIATLDKMDRWLNPVKFSATGFDCKLSYQTFAHNMDLSLGFEQSD